MAVNKYLIFSTEWGWCGGVVSDTGVRAFSLPIRGKIHAAHALLKKSGERNEKAMAFGDNVTWQDIICEIDGRVAGELVRQVREYFRSERTVFDLPLDWQGETKFRQKVWAALLKVGFAEKTSYSRIADELGNKNAARAVAGAVAANPIPLIVPCHRVYEIDGSLPKAFSAEGGLEMREKLNNFENWVLSPFGFEE
jgi:methylated-DNA-[protein]-cysteine S-methyltransferase